MEDSSRYLLIVLGSSKGIDQDLNHIANGETGVNFVDGNSIFMATFYSVLDIEDINAELSHRPAFLLFDITKTKNSIVNLPSKYYNGLFPEVGKISEDLINQSKNFKNVKSNIEECTTVDEVLDKLSKNNYDRSCLTKNELKVLSDAK